MGEIPTPRQTPTIGMFGTTFHPRYNSDYQTVLGTVNDTLQCSQCNVSDTFNDNI